jgi:hypothetical protein
MFHKNYDSKCSVEKENTGHGSQGAWRQTVNHKVTLRGLLVRKRIIPTEQPPVVGEVSYY